MTLATRIAITAPVDIEALHTFLDAKVRPPDRPNPSIVNRRPGEISNQIGQGNHSMLDLAFAPTDPGTTLIDPGDAIAEAIAADAAEGITTDEWSQYEPPLPYFVVIDLDTPYGYTVNGMTATTYHASVIVDVANWLGESHPNVLDPESSPFLWNNEYTSRWHRGLTAEAISQFLGSGDAALEWFTTVATPAIERRGGELA